MGAFIGRKSGIGVIVVLLGISVNYYKNQKVLSPIVETSTGKVQGIVSFTRDGNEIHEFLGIPYGKPPVGELRFADPQKADAWTGVRDATESGPQCMQISFFSAAAGSEDCLHLNVYTPAKRKGLLPVMVWIHGGGFVVGTASRYKPAYLLDENVILVTPNYRLAALGFMNTDDGIVRGNMGLMDQNLALKWVHENIEHFGGDKNQVTLFGESAGSTSVGLHILSPMSKGYFSRAIMQSGSPLADWLKVPKPADQSRQFATKVNCSAENTKAMVECLRRVDAFTLVSAYRDFLFPLTDGTALFVPAVEVIKDSNTFIGEAPLDLLKSGRFHKIPLITGVNKDEGTILSAVIAANHSRLQEANDQWNDFAPRVLSYDTHRHDISEKLRKFYFGNVDSIASKDFVDNYTNIFSDRHFFLPTQRFARYYAEHAPVRMYFYTHEAMFSLSDVLPSTQSERLPIWADAALELIKRWGARKVGYEIPHSGVCHGDEVQLIFSFPLRKYIGEDSRDTEMSKMLLKVWTDFARNKDSLRMGSVEWPVIKLKDAKLKYLNINLNPEIEDENFTDRMRFWDALYI